MERSNYGIRRSFQLLTFYAKQDIRDYSFFAVANQNFGSHFVNVCVKTCRAHNFQIG